MIYNLQEVQVSYAPHKPYRLLSQMYHVALSCLSYYTYFKEIQKQKPKGHNNWWIATHNSYYDLCVLNWCMLFGTEGNEPTHFYHLIGEKYHLREKLRTLKNINPNKTSLKECILSEGSIKYSEFYKFRANTLRYRNKHLIHREHNPNIIQDKCMHAPNTKYIIKSVFPLYKLIVQLAKTFPNHPDNTNKYQHICRIFNDKIQLSNYFLKSFPKLSGESK